jgi:hypothetical protein
MLIEIFTEHGLSGPTIAREVEALAWSELAYGRLARRTAQVARLIAPQACVSAVLAHAPEPRSYVRRRKGYSNIYLRDLEPAQLSSLTGRDHFVAIGEQDVLFSVLTGDASNAELAARFALNDPMHLFALGTPEEPWEPIVERAVEAAHGGPGRDFSLSTIAVLSAPGMRMAASMEAHGVRFAVRQENFQEASRELVRP